MTLRNNYFKSGIPDSFNKLSLVGLSKVLQIFLFCCPLLPRGQLNQHQSSDRTF